jgi:hypothetical protein
VLTDGASSVAEKKSRIVSLLLTSDATNTVYYDLMICHCLMHQDNLCANSDSEVVIMLV